MASPYRKMKKPEETSSDLNQQQRIEQPNNKKKKVILICVVAMAFLLASGIAVTLYVRSRASGSGFSQVPIQPSQEIVTACKQTQYPGLCIDSLVAFPGAQAAGKSDLVRISVNMTLQHSGRAFSGLLRVGAGMSMSKIARQALDDCVELLEESVDHLSKSMAAVADGRSGASDVTTWLSAALTNQDTCKEGLREAAEVEVNDQAVAELKNLEEILSNCLAIYTLASGDADFAGIPIKNRRLLEVSVGRSGFEAGKEVGRLPMGEDGFPWWLSQGDRRLLAVDAKYVQADIEVASDGSATYKTIEEAIRAVPEKSTKRTIIFVKAGRYEENLKVGRKKWNVMIIGEGKGKTVITGSRSVVGGFTTFHTATFAASGTGFIARDISFENVAGPEKHQAVALRVGADHAVVYRCSIASYQDTLYVHSQRQFYRECDIYGTVDFIFGNAAVVIQKSTIYARKPMPNQKNTITAQNRKDPNQNTGISIHDCQILATSDLNGVKSSIPTYLGRPWKMYSRVVYMLSYMGDHINPEGWLPWSGTFALDTLYYGEYMNSGPGAAAGKRVKWPGYREITSSQEASKFTVAQFIYGSSWLPSTGVAFLAGLSQ